MIEMLTLLFTAMVTENLLFTRAIGVDVFATDVKLNVKVGALLALIVTPSALFTSLLSPLLKPLVGGMFEPFVLTFLMLLWYFLVYAGLQMWGTRYHKNTDEISKNLALATFSTAALAVLLIVLHRGLTPLQAIGYSVGAAVGYVLGMLFVCTLNNQIRILRVPRAFAGLPVTLLYIGILSLALYGLIGHRLTA